MDFTELLDPIENSTPISLRRVVLWGPEILLMDSVEFFLKSADWEVVKIASSCGVDYLLKQVATIKPTVVIFCQEKDDSDTTLLMQLAQVPVCWKVVTVSMESNLMQIYSRHHVIMHDVSDLLTIVETRNFSNHTI
jgi:hypothetical protein